MTKSLFNQEYNASIVARIRQLRPDSQAQWGKMNVAQMVKHAQQPLRVAIGELKLKQNIIGFLFGKMAKNKFLKTKSMGKNLPTDKHFIISDIPEFEAEREKLIALVHQMAVKGSDIITKEAHPFFGKMTIEEWDTLQTIHLEHHLEQFGV